MLATVLDRKTGVLPSGGGTLYDHWNADIASATDYYPGGMIMPGRSADPVWARMGFNGKPKDDEVYGKGNFQDYGLRMYDTRIIRFPSYDPLAQSFPELTPYQFAGNRLIDCIDLDGGEPNGFMVAAKAGMFGHTVQQVASGGDDGSAASLKNTANFIMRDAWKAETWKQAGMFVYELGQAGANPVIPAINTPRLDAVKKSFNDNVVNGNTYTRSKALAQFATDLATAYAGSKGIGALRKFAAGRLAIETPYGPAKQSFSAASLSAAENVSNGAELYRIGTLGRSAATEAQFWSLENPATYLGDPEAFASKFGIPAENLASGEMFIESGNLKAGASFITREAPGVGANAGGAVEVVTSPGNVQVNAFNVIGKP